jgi:hypothetical protein
MGALKPAIMKKILILALMLVVMGAFGCAKVDNRMDPEIELHIKDYLSGKYNPKADSGFFPTTDYMENRQNNIKAAEMVNSSDKTTVDFIRRRHSGISDEEVIRMLKQFRNMNVLKKMNDTYTYYFKSVNGCSADEYRGTVTLEEREVKDDVVEVDTVKVPC